MLGSLGELVTLRGTIFAPCEGAGVMRWERNRGSASSVPPWSPRHYTQLWIDRTPADVAEFAPTLRSQVIVGGVVILEGRDFVTGDTYEGDKGQAGDFWYPGNLEYQLREQMGGCGIAAATVWGRPIGSFPGYIAIEAFQLQGGPKVEGAPLSRGDAPPAAYQWATGTWVPYGDRLWPAEEVRRLRQGIDLGYDPSEEMLEYAGGGAGPPLTTEDYVETIEPPRFDEDPFGGAPPEVPEEDVIYYPVDIVDWAPTFEPTPAPGVPAEPAPQPPQPTAPPRIKPLPGEDAPRPGFFPPGPILAPVELPEPGETVTPPGPVATTLAPGRRWPLLAAGIAIAFLLGSR